MSDSLSLIRCEVQQEVAAEALARRFHETYERLAPQFGYETRKDSAVAWENVPERNKNLMIAVCHHLLYWGHLDAAMNGEGGA